MFTALTCLQAYEQYFYKKEKYTKVKQTALLFKLQ